MQVTDIIDDITKPITSLLAYCDYIAWRIKKDLSEHDEKGIIETVGAIKWDLDANGAFRSTAKTMLVTDCFGKQYKITVEEA